MTLILKPFSGHKNEADKSYNTLIPFTQDMKTENDRCTVYLCRNFSCEQPVSSAEALQEILVKMDL